MRRLFSMLVLISTLSVVVQPSLVFAVVGEDIYGAGAAMFGAQQAAESSAKAFNATVSACEAAGKSPGNFLAGKVGSVSGAGDVLGNFLPGGATSLIPGIGQAAMVTSVLKGIPGVSKLFGGGNKAEEVKLDEICKAVKQQVNIAKEQQRQQQKQTALKKWGAVAYKNAITIFFNRLANRMALKVASGLTGQKSTIRSSYNLKDELDAVAGDFLDKALKQYWKRSLCEPLTPFAKVNITVFTRRFIEPPLPQCTFSKIIKNAGDSLSNITDYQDILDLGGYVSPTGNDLGAILTITTNLKLEVATKEGDKRIEQIVGEGFKDYTSKVTGLIKTPSSAIREAAYKYIIHDSTSPYLVFTGEAAADAVGIFTNTLAGKLIDHYLFKQGLNPEADRAAGSGVTNIFSLGIQTIQAAVQKFAKLIESPDLRTGGKIDVLQNLSTPSDDSGDLNACVIDDKFYQAIDADPSLTVKQAIDAGLVDGLRPFGSHALGRGKSDTACQDRNLYSLRSIMILRKYRIVPVGWELAAEYIAERASIDKKDTVFNLSKLMAEYNDPKSPFYRLVDPAWVLKAPENFERRKGYGEAQIEEDSESSSRRFGAVDEQSCIKQNKDGSCAWFGYCVEEKPAWKIDGSECQAQFNSCVSYSSRTGRSLSVLHNSVDQSPSCGTPEAVGCRQYCAFDTTTNAFNCAPSSAPYSPTNRFGSSIYLNKYASECSANAAGCNEFLMLRDKNSGTPLLGTELQPIINAATAGDYTSGDPRSKTDGGYYSSQALVERILLKGQLQECAPEFAGCDLFTPARNREPAIPAIIGNQCLAVCVGYRSFKEGHSYFDFGQGNTQAWPEFYPKTGTVDFIASAARACSAAAAGCEEFTDVVDEQLYHLTYLRQCAPVGSTPNQAVFYTWEGSDTKGFQLKEWNLISDASSGPQGTGCTQAESEINADCRQFYNQNAQTFWILQSTTTFVSDQCKQLRRTKDGAIWYGMLSQATQCSSVDNMCLQYKGASANNVRIVKLGSGPGGYETFDKTGICNNLICGWSAQPSQLSPESIVAGGRSLSVNGSVRTTSVLSLKQGAVYELSYWIKGVGLSVQIVASGSQWQQFRTNTAPASPTEWEYVRASLVPSGYLEITPDTDNKTYLEFTGNGFIDNIVLRETPDSMFLIQNSWIEKMPKDKTTGALLCDATQLGCEEYKNRKGQKVYVSEFASLCPLEAVGCVAAVDTKDSSKTLATNVRGVSTPADSLIYVVDNPKAYCLPQEKGCVRVGMVGTNSNRTPQFTNSFKIVDPDLYEQELCTQDQEYCEEFTSENGVGSTVFKDPTNFLCEFKTNVAVKSGPQRVSGWFVAGTAIPCPTLTTEQSGITGRCMGGRSTMDPIGNVCTSNAKCTNHSSPGKEGYCVSTSFTDTAVTPATTSNFAGSNKPFGVLCPSGQSSCFELQDPQNPLGCDPVLLFGESALNHYIGNPVLSKNKACNYYYYLSNSLTPSGCNGQNPDEGCVGFFDTSRPATFSSQKQCLNVNGSPVFPAVQCKIDTECSTGRCGYP